MLHGPDRHVGARLERNDAIWAHDTRCAGPPRGWTRVWMCGHPRDLSFLPVPRAGPVSPTPLSLTLPHRRALRRAGKGGVISCRSDTVRSLRGATPAHGAPAPGAGARQVGRRDDGARGAPTRQRGLDPAQPNEHAAQRRVECHTMLLSRHPHHRSRCWGVGTCSVSTAVRVEASLRRSYRWVVGTLACPASCGTVEISTWASNRSDTMMCDTLVRIIALSIAPRPPDAPTRAPYAWPTHGCGRCRPPGCAVNCAR